jgi:hypothetical protein
MAMRVRAKPVWGPKQGNQEDEYEDACWPDRPWEAEGARLRFAVADGASESCFARRWAKTLVDAVGEGRLEMAQFEEGLTALQEQWREWLSGKSLPWYAEEKARSGSFAALVVLILTDPGPEISHRGEWQALAFGDSCLLHVRGDRLLVRFPIEQSSEFSNRPHLLGSRRGSLATAAERLKDKAGGWEREDKFYLMTDALGCWCLKEIEAGGKPWDSLDALMMEEGDAAFRGWVDGLRSRGGIRNDDCTLLRIAVE